MYEVNRRHEKMWQAVRSIFETEADPSVIVTTEHGSFEGKITKLSSRNVTINNQQVPIDAILELDIKLQFDDEE